MRVDEKWNWRLALCILLGKRFYPFQTYSNNNFEMAPNAYAEDNFSGNDATWTKNETKKDEKNSNQKIKRKIRETMTFKNKRNII